MKLYSPMCHCWENTNFFLLVSFVRSPCLPCFFVFSLYQLGNQVLHPDAAGCDSIICHHPLVSHWTSLALPCIKDPTTAGSLSTDWLIKMYDQDICIFILRAYHKNTHVSSHTLEVHCICKKLKKITHWCIKSTPEKQAKDLLGFLTLPW